MGPRAFEPFPDFGRAFRAWAGLRGSSNASDRDANQLISHLRFSKSPPPPSGGHLASSTLKSSSATHLRAILRIVAGQRGDQGSTTMSVPDAVRCTPSESALTPVS